jgi:hypothetical protein
MPSILQQVTESMGKALRESDYFRTSPIIPVLQDDEKEVFKQIEIAGSRTGAFVMISFEGTGDSDADTPGPDLGDCQFVVTCVEIPAIWRQKPGLTNPASQISEAVANILQNHRPLDENGAAVTGGGLIFKSIKSQTDESTIQYAVTFSIGLYIQQTEPSR